MNVVAINGSPRKNWNTAALLQHALEGAASQGAQTKLVHLYDLEFRGCISCFACKTRGGKSYGRCAVQDALAPVLRDIEDADALLLGSPIYLGTVTGEMRSFMERLLFPYLTYTDPPRSLFPRQIRAGFVYAMGAPEELAKERGFDRHVLANEAMLQLIFGAARSFVSYDTLQFDDYSTVVAERFDPEHKARRRTEVFPLDCRKARDLGAWLAGKDL